MCFFSPIRKMPALDGAVSERNFCEICRRKSPQNTEKHKTKLCAEVPERPLPKDPLLQLLIFLLQNEEKTAERVWANCLCKLFLF